MRLHTTHTSLLGVLITFGAFMGSGLASAAGQEPSTKASRAGTSGCEGVRILTRPYLAIGIGPIVTDVSGLLGGPVLCQPVPLGARQPARSRSAGSARSGCTGAGTAGHKLRPRQAAAAVRCLINAKRNRKGKGGLSDRRELKKAAKKHSRRMVKKGCFSHRCPGEPDLIGRVTSTGYLPCSCGWSVGENLAWGPRRRGSPRAVVKAWMKSPPHRANILNGAFEHVDVGVRKGKPGKGRSRAATYTVNFGYRR